MDELRAILGGRIHVEGSRMGCWRGKRALCSVGLFSGSEKHMFEHSVRVHPLYFHYLFEKADDVHIELPLVGRSAVCRWRKTTMQKPLPTA